MGGGGDFIAFDFNIFLVGVSLSAVMFCIYNVWITKIQ